MKVRALGGAREVGGSCISVETENSKVALDYGIKLDEVTDQYPKNFDAIIVSHAHLDHSGSLLRLSKTRRAQYIMGPKITRDVTAELLKDMIKIQATKGNPEVYSDQTVEKIKESWHIHEAMVLPGMQIQLHSAGHVVGARMVEVRCEGKTLLYTGDFCIHGTEILDGCNPDLLPKPDVLITESTYGGRIRPPRDEVINQFFKLLNSTVRKRGNILIPTFAFHRSQEMAKRIDQAIESGVLPPYNVYTISNLAKKITSHFNSNKHLFSEKINQEDNPFDYKHVQNIEQTTEIDEPAIAISTPGFGHAGASLSLLQQWAEGEENLLILTSGYLPPDSPLKIAKEKRYFREEGEKIPIQAKIQTIELSGHADQLELIELVAKLKPKHTVLVHGDLDQAEALSKKISGFTDVSIPEKGDTLDF